MRLLEVGMKNYKSLRDVTFKPGDLSVLIGPNGAGKSNLCDALDFIGEIYRFGLDDAIAGRGGFERIRFRDNDISGAELSLSIQASLSAIDLKPAWKRRTDHPVPAEVLIRHELSIRGQSQDGHIDPYQIAGESISYDVRPRSTSKPKPLLSLSRLGSDQTQVSVSAFARESLPMLAELSDDRLHDLLRATISAGPTRSLASVAESLILPIVPIAATLGTITLHQLAPSPLRAHDVPRPNPRLHRDGSNVASVVAWLKTQEPRLFSTVLNTVSTVMPTLDDIDVVHTSLKGLQLSFQEAGFEHSWRAEEVSDGTLRTLGLMVALIDPNTHVVVIEEPENSLHSWAIWQFMDACREAVKTKQVILTTHSPALIDQLHPENVWIVSKHDVETAIHRLIDVDPVARDGWEAGHFTLAEYLETGLAPGSVPVLAR